MPEPRNEVAEVTGLLGKHRLSPLGGHWQCACGENFGPRTRSYGRAAEVRDEHDFHVAKMLLAEGLTMGSKDPREKFLRRIKGTTHPA